MVNSLIVLLLTCWVLAKQVMLISGLDQSHLTVSAVHVGHCFALLAN